MNDDASERPAERSPAPTYQPDLFRRMCWRSVATQREMFPEDAPGGHPRPPGGPRIPDLPGQQTFA